MAGITGLSPEVGEKKKRCKFIPSSTIGLLRRTGTIWNQVFTVRNAFMDLGMRSKLHQVLSVTEKVVGDRILWDKC